MNIIAMSVFGDNPRYVIGAYKQVYLAKHYYPDFDVWLFADRPERYKLDCKVIGMPALTDGTFWRLLAGTQTGVIIFRDVDSRISMREMIATTEWISSGKSLHIMRDHERHNSVHNPILAGMFGIRGPWPPSIIGHLMTCMHQPFSYGNDQGFLRDHVYPLFCDDVMVHSLDDGWFGESRKHLVNPYNWVGQGWDEDDRPIYAFSNDGFQGFDRFSLPEKFRFSEY
jgi:hypothetical protein